MNILAGDGIGIGICDSGKIFARSSACSSEMGHITISYKGRPCTCGSRGCLNAYSSVRALLQIAGEEKKKYPESLLNDKEEITLPDILKGMNAGDPLCVKLIEDEGQYLGNGLVSLLHVVQPDLVVVSGQLAAAGDLLLDNMKKAFEKRESCFIEPPVFSLHRAEGDLMLEGAAAFAFDRVLDRPTEYLHLSKEEQ